MLCQFLTESKRCIDRSAAMKCFDNSSDEFSYYAKAKHFYGLSGGAVGPCRPFTADGDQSAINVTAAFCQAPNGSATGDSGISAGEMTSYNLVEMYLYTVIIPVICLIGIIGNTINLVVLTSIVRNKPMDRMERSATVGLLALAVSDLFFCIAVIPLSFVDDIVISDRLTFALVYLVYHPAVISTFITLSTWLTVVMAVSRYLAICHPLKARIIIGMRFALGSIAVAFLFSILLNVPRFFQSAVACVMNSDAVSDYFAMPGQLQRHGALGLTYYVLYLIIGILLPLIVLAYSNFFLIRAIRNSRRMRRQFQRHGREGAAGVDTRHQQHSQADTTNALTLTLTVIVIMYAVLVSPAEITNIFTQMIDTHQKTEDSRDADVQSDDEDQQQASIHQDSYNVAVAVGNTLQTLNFACNFILYCAVNVHFRRIVREMVTCRPWWRWPVTRPITSVATNTNIGLSQTHHTNFVVSPSTACRRSHLQPIIKSHQLDVSDVDEFD